MAAILGAFGLFTGFFRDLRELFSDRAGKAILMMVASLIVIGTIFYNLVEGWSVVDSFYFSVVTLTTVGYGDLSPDTTVGKLFTTIYIFSGLSIIAAFASNIAKTHIKRVAGQVDMRTADKVQDAVPNENASN